MLVKFGYCIICDNGPDRENREWVGDLLKERKTFKQLMKVCTTCKQENNTNLLYLEIDIPGLGLVS